MSKKGLIGLAFVATAHGAALADEGVNTMGHMPRIVSTQNGVVETLIPPPQNDVIGVYRDFSTLAIFADVSGKNGAMVLLTLPTKGNPYGTIKVDPKRSISFGCPVAESFKSVVGSIADSLVYAAKTNGNVGEISAAINKSHALEAAIQWAANKCEI